MPNRSLDELVEIFESQGFVVGPQPEARVRAAERLLSIQLPPSYRAFTKRVGSGSVHGIEIYGVLTDDPTNSSVPDAIWLTLEAREEWGIPHSAIVFYFDGSDGYYILDVRKANKTGEPPVELWLPGESNQTDPCERVGDSFIEVLSDLIAEQL